jgi:hypothetical protein
MNLLLTQFHDSPNLNAVQDAFLEQIAELETVFEQLRNLIDQAAGAQLDMLGRIVGQKRLGMNDEDYRLWIDARILLNKSRGIESDMRELLKALIAQEVEIKEHPEIAFTVLIQQVCQQDAQRLFEIINEAKPLGVQAHLQVAMRDPVFRFDTPQIRPSHLSEWIA